MNNLELYAVFQSEEEALKRAFDSLGLTKDSPLQERPKGFQGLLWDVFEFPDDVLCKKIKDYLDAGNDPDATPSESGVTAFRLCFEYGKMASMRMLLHAGAKSDWTPDQVSIALGKVPKAPQTGKADPFCFACRVGNLIAAQECLSRSNSGRDKNTSAVIAAVRSRATDVVKWLMDLGFDPNAVDDIKWGALERAVDNNDVATAEVLLEAGAAPFGEQGKSYTSPVEEAVSNEMRKLFVEHGVNPASFDYGPSTERPNLAKLPKSKLTIADFEAYRTNQMGQSNPEAFLPAFWSEQMRDDGYSQLEALGYAPNPDKPVWSFERFGRTATLLPDGRMVFVAGEHEDDYHADFCIYADVTVLGIDGNVEHFIYPEHVFPPTDFHTSTLIDDHIWLIGSLGYPEQRKDGETQVLRLNTIDFSIQPVCTTGSAPGWIHGHRSVLMPDGILVTGGKIEPGYVDNNARHLLNLETLEWSELSNSDHSLGFRH